MMKADDSVIDLNRTNRIKTYISKLTEKRPDLNGKELYLEYREDLLRITPQEAFEVFYDIWQKGQPAAEILEYLDKAINVFHHGLKAYPWEKPSADSFIGTLRQENEALIARLDQISSILQSDHTAGQRDLLYNLVAELKLFDCHYLKKENILFPYLEKKQERFNGVAIMWSLHDEARSSLSETLELLSSDAHDNSDETSLHVAIGRLFFAMHGLASKEELILFPAACESFSAAEFEDMLRQSFEYGFAYIEKIPDRPPAANNFSGLRFETDTGSLDMEQLVLLFSALPVDLTFVDETNRVRFFTRPKDRIFPRSPAVIGRDVKNCHPPESVHVVEEIVDSFRCGEQDQASFWIDIRERKILIQYFALRDEKGQYKGVLEVSQDITDIRALEGQRRILQWINQKNPS
jgi:DUF438 domain-containing protein